VCHSLRAVGHLFSAKYHACLHWPRVRKIRFKKDLSNSTIRVNQLPSPGGSMVLRYVLQLLFSEKAQIINNLTTTESRQKVSKHLKYVDF
jgi:hypothetical protein